MVACGDGVAAGLRVMALDFVERRVPGGQTHHDRRQVLRDRLPLGQALEIAAACGGDRGRDGKRDPARWTGLRGAAHGGLGLFQRCQGGRRVRGGGNPRSVDSIEKVEADIRLPGDRQRLVEERSTLCAAAAVERDLGSPLQREGLARRGRDLAVKRRTRGEVGVCLVELPGEQLRFAAYRHCERAPARGTEPLGLLREGVRERDHVGIRPRPVKEPLRHAELAVEDADGQLG